MKKKEMRKKISDLVLHNNWDKIKELTIYDSESLIFLIEIIIKESSEKDVYTKIAEFWKIVGSLNNPSQEKQLIADKLKEIIVKLKNKKAKRIFEFAKSAPIEWIDTFVDVVIVLNRPNYMYDYCCYIKNIPNAPINKLMNAIIATGDAEHIFKFARDIKGTDTIKLMNAIIKTNNAEYIFKFARNVKGSDTVKLINAIIATGDAEYIYYSACELPEVPIDEAVKAIIKTNNVVYMYLFAANVPNAPIEVLMHFVNESIDLNSRHALIGDTSTLTLESTKNLFMNFLKNTESFHEDEIGELTDENILYYLDSYFDSYIDRLAKDFKKSGCQCFSEFMFGESQPQEIISHDGKIM